MPLRFEAAILSRIRSPVTSRSNWAKERRTFRVSRSHGGGGIELLGDRHKADALFIECLNDLGKVSQRSRQPVDLIYNDGIDSSGSNVLKQAFEGGPLHVSTGVTAVIVFRCNRLPAFVPLAENIGFASLALGMERIEGLLQTLLGRFAGLNRTTHAGGYCHTVFFLVPKNSGPDQGVPVISRAILDRLVKCRPR